MNSLPLTKGIITRRRKYLDKTVESTIDFYVVCESVLPLIKSMEIIDHTNHNLTKYSINSKAVSSDHAPLVMDIELKARPIIREKIEIPNFYDNTAQLKLKESTSDTIQFTECFKNMQPSLEQSQNWLSTVELGQER